MSSNIAHMLAAESEHYEAHYNDPETAPTHARRRPGGKTPRLLVLRLSEDQYTRVAAEAQASDLPVSTLARNILMARIDRSEQQVSAQVEDTIRRILKPELLRA